MYYTQNLKASGVMIIMMTCADEKPGFNTIGPDRMIIKLGHRCRSTKIFDRPGSEYAPINWKSKNGNSMMCERTN
jgi:hypothetical protein